MWRRIGLLSVLLGAPLASASKAAHLNVMVTKESPNKASPSTSPATSPATTPSAASDEVGTVTTASDSSLSSSTDTVGATTKPSKSTNSSGWHMSPVTVVQARVQGDAPVWNAKAKMWLSKYGDTADLAYMNNMDTVNTASVEGALMYVQAEGINVNEQSVKCHRKNDMQYVVFYEVTIVEPTYSIKYYETHQPPEYGEFVAMDGAKCTDVGAGVSEDCKVYYGLNKTMDIGLSVGGNAQTTDPRAPYPGNYWFSFPGSCAQELRADKTDECRKQYPGGLCAMGTEPNGDDCTFSYKILGFLNIDDLVGITKMGYKNYTAFCEDGGVEFSATNTGSGFKVTKSIDFWANPGEETANVNRTNQMVKLYNQMASNGSSTNMMPLPSVEKLTSANPKCYENSAACASSQYGCNRTLYAQVCTVCSSAAPGCEAAPSSFKFPTLKLPSNSTSDSGGPSDSKSKKTSGSSFSHLSASTASVLVAIAAMVASNLM